MQTSNNYLHGTSVIKRKLNVGYADVSTKIRKTELYGKKQKHFSYLSCNFLGLRYRIKLFLKFVQSSPVVSNLIFNIVRVYSCHWTIHPLTVKYKWSHSNILCVNNTGINSHIKVYTDVPLEWVNFFNLQIWLGCNFSLQYFNGWEF